MNESSPQISMVLATKSRKNELRRALTSVFLQEGVDFEVIVMDDCSDDGTAEMVRSEFPKVRLERRDKPMGVAVRRTEGARLARAPYIFSIDDDAEYTTPHVFYETLREFDHPRIGAVAIPHADVPISPQIKTPTPPCPGLWVVPAFIGTSYAIRREVFLALGGYRSILVHSTEERDFCVRMLNAGFVVRLGTSGPVHHFCSPIRNAWVARMLERRNDVCHALWDVPFPHLLYHLPGTVLSGLIYGVKAGCLSATLTGYWRAPGVVAKGWSQRSPISSSVYRLLRRLNSTRLLPLDEVEAYLPPLPILTYADH